MSFDSQPDIGWSLRRQSVGFCWSVCLLMVYLFVVGMFVFRWSVCLTVVDLCVYRLSVCMSLVSQYAVGRSIQASETLWATHNYQEYFGTTWYVIGWWVVTC